jgi:hypothetical protein
MYATTRLFNRRNLLVAFLLLFVMSVAYGFAANNVVGDSSAGDGVGEISGYEITGVTYDLKVTDPRELASVSFTMEDDGIAANGVATDPTTVMIAFPADALIATQPAQAEWYTCTPAALGATVTCDLNAQSVLVHDIDFLRVVAAN